MVTPHADKHSSLLLMFALLQYLSSSPSVVVVDDVLTPAALENLRQMCLQTTVRSMHKAPRLMFTC